ncbi:MAG: hypothetical protein HUJ30_02730 [Gammaproteobacteria bacterium]|nr:hypothetical protein [Gammaproteobacteria bacterium]
MAKENYAAAEAYQGEYHQGFKTRDEAIAYVHKRLDQVDREDDYAWRVLRVLDEWDSDALLPGEQ